jgi:hypothetical protein
MDYKAFFADVLDWINESNRMAARHGFENIVFWEWVSHSIGELSNKYDNNKFVINQMVMLFQWLEEVYEEWRGSNDGR